MISTELRSAYKIVLKSSWVRVITNLPNTKAIVTISPKLKTQSIIKNLKLRSAYKIVLKSNWVRVITNLPNTKAIVTISPKLKTQSIIKNLKKSRFNTRMFRNHNVPDLAQVFLNQWIGGLNCILRHPNPTFYRG